MIRMQGFLAARKFKGLALTLEAMSIPKELADKAVAFAEHFDLSGVFHLDFVLSESSGEPQFLEVNCRLGGTTGKAVACEYEEPLYLLAAYGLEDPPPLHVTLPPEDASGHSAAPAGHRTIDTHHSNSANKLVANRQALCKYLYRALRGRTERHDFPHESSLQAVRFACRALLTAKDDVWDWRDLKGSTNIYLSALARKLR